MTESGDDKTFNSLPGGINWKLEQKWALCSLLNSIFGNIDMKPCCMTLLHNVGFDSDDSLNKKGLMIN